MTTFDDSPVLLSHCDARGVHTLTLNRPAAFNALSETLLAALRAELAHIASDERVRVQGMATAAGCQLVAQCDLAVATTDARFAVSGIKLGLFCSTPSVALSRNLGGARMLSRCCSRVTLSAPTRPRSAG